MNLLECTIDRQYFKWKIYSETTIKSYVKQKQKNATFQEPLDWGGPIPLNALEKAVIQGNAVLTDYIAKNEPNLLSCSTSYFGPSPLVRAVLMTDHALGLKIAQILIAYGADCNLKTVQKPEKTIFGEHCGLEVYPNGATPIVIALEKTRNWSLMMFLAGIGCRIEYTETEDGKQILYSELSGDTKTVYQGLQGCRLFLLNKVNNTIDLNQYPNIIHCIVSKLFDMIKEIPTVPDKDLVIPTRPIPSNRSIIPLKLGYFF